MFDQNNNTLSGSNINWYSNNSLVASVNTTGLVTARANGSAVIIATSGNAKGQATVSVDGPIPTRIAITPTTVNLTASGQTRQLTAVVYDQRDRVVDGAAVSWSSGDSTVATVNDEGLVTARANGSAVIIATSGNAKGSATIVVAIIVDVPTPTRIAVSPTSVELTAPGQTKQLSAVVYDQQNRVMAGAAVSWSSSHPTIAAVNDEGLVTAISYGGAIVSARSGNASSDEPIYILIAVPRPNQRIHHIQRTIDRCRPDYPTDRCYRGSDWSHHDRCRNYLGKR